MSNKEIFALHSVAEETDAKPGSRPGAALPLDKSRYWGELAELNLTDEQADELLAALWSIMSSCVALGFKVDILDKILSAEKGETVESTHSKTMETLSSKKGETS